MERFIIIDDKKCEKELAEFLEANKEHIRYNTTLTCIKSSPKGFFEELKSEFGSEDKLAINSNQQIEIVHTRDITYLEAIEGKTKLYFANKHCIETNSNLDSFGIKLKSSNFMRIHERIIINLDYFSKLDIHDSNTLVLTNSIKVPVDPERKSLLLQFLNKIDIQKNIH